MTTYAERSIPETGCEIIPQAALVRGADPLPFRKRIAAQLQGKGVETFLPLLNETHRWSDRQKIISLPLFSGYVFVRLPPSASPARAKVLRTQGVMGFVQVHGDASPIPSRQIDDLRRLLAHKLPCALHAFLKVGQRVRIRGGCLDGLEGILAQSTQKTLVISIECIERSWPSRSKDTNWSWSECPFPLHSIRRDRSGPAFSAARSGQESCSRWPRMRCKGLLSPASMRREAGAGRGCYAAPNGGTDEMF